MFKRDCFFSRFGPSGIRTRYGENAENADGPSHPSKQVVLGDAAERKCGKCGHQNPENAETAADWLQCDRLWVSPMFCTRTSSWPKPTRWRLVSRRGRSKKLKGNDAVNTTFHLERLHMYQGSKKNPNPKLFGPDIFGWGGGLPRGGVGGQKVRYVL